MSLDVLERRGVITTDPAAAEECCGLPRDDDGFCVHRPGHPIFLKGSITQADVFAAFNRGQARTLRLLAEAAAAGVKPHASMPSVGHMTHPDDAYHCCPFGPGHPIHEVQVAR